MVSATIKSAGGLEIPITGLGTLLIKDEQLLDKTLTRAFQLGYRHIDTAFFYQNEEFIGRTLKKIFASGKLKREDIFITTKLPFMGVHPDRVELFMKKSLKSLQLDYVDLYLIHFPIGSKYVEGQPQQAPDQLELEEVVDHVAVWKKMEEQVDAGRTKAIGLSNFNQKQIERVLKSARIKPACLQVEIHVDLQQRELVKFCQQNGIVVVAYCPLSSAGSDRWPRFVPIPLQNETVKRIAAKHGKTSAQVLLRYLLQKNIVVIPKTEKPERLKENIDIFDFNIDEADMKSLDDLEVGEKARFVNPGIRNPRMLNHPEYPFPK